MNAPDARAAVPDAREEAAIREIAALLAGLVRRDAAAQVALAGHLSFTPWHSRPEHAPLGGINHVRRVACETVSRPRHEINGVVRREPTSLEIEPDLIIRRDTAWERPLPGKERP